MHFTPIPILLSLTTLGFTTAQTTSTPTTVATVTSTTVSIDPTQSAIYACLDACPAGDVNCTAKCIAVPNPDAAAVNATNNCVAACPQGKGTATDNLNYQNCVDGCIGKYYFTTSGTPSNPTLSGTRASTGTGVVAPTGTGAGASNSGKGTTGTPTGTAAPGSATSNAADGGLRVGGMGVGLGALMAAVLAF